MPAAYPLVFRPVLLEKVWGGRALAQFGKPLPDPAARYGESWELADLDATSASGAGGSAVRSVVENGPLAGRTIREALAVFDPSAHEIRPFPLLIKFLDAAENLSVQVHPSEAVVRAAAAAGAPGVHLKTESWYVLSAAPGARLYIGLREGVTRDQVESAVRSGDGPRIVALLRELPALAGECHTLPSGIVHALGAGVVVAEVQTPSDTTYRLYDWGRTGREAHVEQALASAFDDRGRVSATDAPRAGPMAEGELCARLAETARYVIDETRPRDGDEVTIGFPCERTGALDERGFVLMVIAGDGSLGANDGSFAPLTLHAGVTVFVPGACARAALLRAGRGLRALRIAIPP
ncbi:MAG: class I mannose-6-phosphate isomerase [Phycisphaeraceae bacterium]|nr:class I mannose-6-phosphate isomerase [Phycisphaeraceae bacterium]